MQFVDANYVSYQPSNWLTYDDVSLIPAASDINSRNDPRLDLTTDFVPGVKMKVPIISANMDTVTEASMVQAMAGQGAFGILHRFYKTPEAYIDDIKIVGDKYGGVAFSIGANPEDLSFVENVLKTSKAKHHIVCVDIAHGHLSKCIQQVATLRKAFGNTIKIISGNVCTPDGAVSLIQAGTDSIKVNITNGSHCTTRLVTGFGVPALSAIMHCRRAINGQKRNISLIADGGIRHSGDIVKALAAGADSVMIGRLFAATEESPGAIIDQYHFADGAPLAQGLRAISGTDPIPLGTLINKVKKYRGQSSQDFLNDSGKSGVAPEGESSHLPYQGSVKPILEKLIGGIKSGMSYAGVTNLSDLNRNAVFIEISRNAYIEGTPHGAI